MTAALELLIVTHIHTDGSPAAGLAYDGDLDTLTPWSDLGGRPLDDTTRVVDNDGRPAYLVDLDDGRRLPKTFRHIVDAFAAGEAAFEAVDE